MNTRTPLSLSFAVGTRRLAIVGSLGVVWAASACGGSDVKCGAGTTKQGNTCVATGAVTPGTDAGKADAGTGTGGVSYTTDSGTGGGGGATDAGESQGGGGGGAGAVDSGSQSTEGIVFGGVTSADPADETPPGGTTDKPGLIRVSWSPATYPGQPDAIIHYEIFESDKSGIYNFKAPTETAPPGSTSFVLQDLTGGPYFFVVRAVADRGTARDENTREASTSAAFDDKAPVFTAGVQGAEPAGPTSVKVSWNAATDDHTSAAGIVYRVSWTDRIGGGLTLGAVSLPGADSAIVTGLPNALTQYYFQVNAVDAAGNAEKNNVQVAGSTGPDVKPPVFGGCTAVTNISAGSATVMWAPAVDDTTPASQIIYNVYAEDVPVLRGQPLGDPVTVPGATSIKLTNLNSATLYRFICRAQDAAGNEDDNLVMQLGATSNDPDPPTFAGAVSATADANTDEAAIVLTWAAASDIQSATANIKYVVYVSTTPGNEDFAGTPIPSLPGQTSMTVANSALLPIAILANPDATSASNTDFYFVVRAQDEAGNEDTNTVEVSAKTIVSFKSDVQTIFTGHCALFGCHSTLDPQTPPKQGQNLEKGEAYASIVNVTALEGAQIGLPNIKRISTDGVPENSYMYHKINGIQPYTGSTMPPAIANAPLSQAEKDTIRDWILQGAKDN